MQLCKKSKMLKTLEQHQQFIFLEEKAEPKLLGVLGFTPLKWWIH